MLCLGVRNYKLIIKRHRINNYTELKVCNVILLIFSLFVSKVFPEKLKQRVTEI